MATINLRNNTDFFVKVDGISGIVNTPELADETMIAPNGTIEDKTIQWSSVENKQIHFYTNERGDGGSICDSSLIFNVNDGVYVNRGVQTSGNTIKLNADVTDTFNRVELETEGPDQKLLDWELLNDSTVINISFNK
jgi:hypothetical protein